MTGIVTVINALANVKYRRESTEARNSIAVKTEEIHQMVNGSSEVAATKLESLEAQIAALNLEIRRIQEMRLHDHEADGRAH